MGEWPERLEIHIQLSADQDGPEPSDSMFALEEEMDELLKGLGALEGNEIGPDEWVTFVDCSDAEAALEKLTPKLKALRAVGSIYVIKCTRVVVS